MQKKIVVIGPESTGKSTLSSQLAGYYRTEWVPEYARRYLEELAGDYREEDLLKIAKGQIALENTMARKAGELLICDTDLLVLKVWSDHKYGRTHPWILEQIASRYYDFYLLTDIDIPWEFDPQREHPELREYFFSLYKFHLQSLKKPFVVISGNSKERLNAARKAIDSLL